MNQRQKILSITAVFLIVALSLVLAVVVGFACDTTRAPKPQVVVVTATPDPSARPEERIVVVTATPKPTSTHQPMVTPRTPQATRPATMRATTSSMPTPTTEREGLIIRRPTPTRKPTATVGPTPTPAPTPWEMTDSNNICYRSPSVQRALMAALDINLCQAVTIGELFRLDGELSFGGITLHPQDLEGLVNLKKLGLSGVNLQYQNFQHTPDLINLVLDYPVDYKHLELAHLTKLQYLEIKTENAECTLLKRGYIKQLLGGLENLQEVYFYGKLLMPREEQDHELVQRRVQTEVLSATGSALARENIKVSIEMYDPEDSYSANIVPSCSDGH